MKRIRKAKYVFWIILGMAVLLLFPYDVLNGIEVGGYVIDVGRYSLLGGFLSGVTSILAIILIYFTYNHQLSTQRVLKFETAFFEALRLFNDYRSNKIFTNKNGKERVQGYQFFLTMINEVFYRYYRDSKGDLNQSIKNTFNSFPNLFSYYFGLLNSCLFLIHKEYEDDASEMQYVKYISLQVSEYEKMLIEHVDDSKFEFIGKYKK